MASSWQTLELDLGDRSYPIHIGSGLLGQPELIRQRIRGKQVFVVTNETVAPLYLEKLRASLEGYHYGEVILPDGEQHKTTACLERIYDGLLEGRHNRSTTLIALGGGVVGDMTGYAAASYQRGVDFIQVPTTLLSQVDSSVGGKTGVNHRLGKNMIGAFHQPRCVLIDTDSLATLPRRELSAGVAEVIKYGLICDSPFYSWLEANMERLMALDEEIAVEAIYRSCENKAKVVASDERESGIRAILNLGHTFGHAIETAQGYGNWLHGEAVGVGMRMAAEMSRARGWVSEVECEGLDRLLERAELPLEPPEMTQQQFVDLMAVDKKVIDGRLRLVLMKSLGEACISDDVGEDELRRTLGACGVEVEG